MKLDRRSLFTAAAVVAVLYLLAAALGLPGWAAVLMAIVLLTAGGVLVKEPVAKPAATPAPGTAPTPRTPDPVFTLPPTRTVADVRLPSASPDFQFTFAAVVHWSAVLSGSRHADLGSLAVDALLKRAKVLTAGQQPTEESLNQHRLAALLGEPALDDRGQVRVWATEVRLRLTEADSRYLQALTALHRREQTTLLERRLEREQRAYLKEEVLATPGSAAVWWLANNPGKVEQAVQLLGTLARLSAAANNDAETEAPPAGDHQLTEGNTKASAELAVPGDTSAAELAADRSTAELAADSSTAELAALLARRRDDQSGSREPVRDQANGTYREQMFP